MKKQNLPPFEELIERLYNSIVLRNPNKPSGQGLIDKLTLAYEGKHAELYKMVKQLEINEHKANVLNQKIDVRQTEFCTGVDVLGFPTFTQHIVKFENLTRDPKRYKKKGSTFSQELVSAAQIEFKEGIKLKIISAFKR
jgi:hypothetical protein